MNVSIEEISACRKRLTIEVPADQVNAAMDSVTAEYQKLAKLPGFRPGKAPLPVVRTKYKDEIEDETKRKVVTQAYREAIEAKKLRPVSQPSIEDLNFTPGFTLSFTTLVELAPDFKLPPYKGIKLKAVDTEVDDKRVDETIDQLRESRAEYVDVVDPRPLAYDDFAQIGFVARVDDQPMKELLPSLPHLAENPNFHIKIMKDGFLPGFVDQIVGMNIGQKRDIEVTIPHDFPEEAVAGKKAQYHVELKKIQNQKLPEFNDKMAQEIAQVNAEELRERIKSNLTELKESEARKEKTRQVIDHLLQAVIFELPESLVEEETEQTVYDIVSENQQRGIAADVLEQHRDEIYKNATRSAEETVRLNLICENIAEEEKLEVSREEIAQALSVMALQEQIPVKKFIKQAQQNGAIEGVRQRLMAQKVLDFILKEAKFE